MVISRDLSITLSNTWLRDDSHNTAAIRPKLLCYNKIKTKNIKKEITCICRLPMSCVLDGRSSANGTKGVIMPDSPV